MLVHFCIKNIPPEFRASRDGLDAWAYYWVLRDCPQQADLMTRILGLNTSAPWRMNGLIDENIFCIYVPPEI